MFTTRPEIRGTFGVAATTHWLASAAAMGALERGGNAFDAAVTAAFVLQVVEPHLNGPGGEVPIILWDAKTQTSEVICGQGVAPAAATIERFRALDLDLVPGTGLLPACVPGAFDSWMRLLRDRGTFRLEDVLAPAIGYAAGGYPLVPRIPAAIETVKDFIKKEWPSTAMIYLPGGEVPKAGRLFRNPLLAATWRRLLDEARAGGASREDQIEAARRAWYKGFVAEAIDRFCRTHEVMDNSGRPHRGLLTGDDLATWESLVEKPATIDYRGHTVAKCGFWSQGPVFLQQIALLAGFDVAGMDPLGPDFVHTVTECAKLAFADREAWYGDPDFVDVPAAALLSRAYADERRKLVGERASLEQRPGRPDGRTPVLFHGAAGRAGGPGLGEPTVGVGEPTMARNAELATSADGSTRGDTVHIDVIDRWGNMIAATPSGGWFQSSPAIPELGFALGTRGQMFWLEEGLPASLAPGKRPRTTLSPSFVFREGDPYMPFGTPGGDQQDQWSVLHFLHHVDHQMNLQESIDLPAFHNEHMTSSFYPREAKPGTLVLEGRMPAATVEELRRRGHKVEVGDLWSEGRLCACAAEKTPEGTILKAGANPRGMQGYAVGR
jgi:gamma-glutamyltranspeptidase/glutathione hydrolase